MESNIFSIVVDAMGGDFAPEEVVKGAYDAVNFLGTKIILIGDIKKIKTAADSNNLNLDSFNIIQANQTVLMNDSPSEVLKKKKDSSIYLGSKIVSEGKGGAFLSAGNTGAVMACSLFNIKRIKGISRPAIAVIIPVADGRFVLIDAGANADCKPQYLKQFAVMGKVYAQNILNITNPRIALLNIGEEEKKGNELTIESYKLFKNSQELNFIGNIEGREVFDNCADVVVCDGFTGNIILKSVEGLAKMFFREIKTAFTANVLNRISALGLKGSMVKLKKKFDYEEYGGAYLLGLNSPVIISHGSSKSKAIYNAIRVAAEGLKTDLATRIKDEINKSTIK